MSRINIWQRLKEVFISEPPKVRLTEEAVLKIADEYATGEGGVPLRPRVRVSVLEENDALIWHVFDHAQMRGGSYHLYISDATGEVLKTWGTPK